MTEPSATIPFHLSAAMTQLTACDEKLAELIANTIPFKTDSDQLQSPYEALLACVAYKSTADKL